MTIGKRIKHRRIHLGMAVDDLAKKLNKNRATIYRYEKGDIENLPLDVLEPLAKALDTTTAYIMGWTINDDDTNKIIESVIEDLSNKTDENSPIYLQKVREILYMTYYDILSKSKLYNPVYNEIYKLKLTDDELNEVYEYAVYVKSKRKNN